MFGNRTIFFIILLDLLLLARVNGFTNRCEGTCSRRRNTKHPRETSNRCATATARATFSDTYSLSKIQKRRRGLLRLRTEEEVVSLPYKYDYDVVAVPAAGENRGNNNRTGVILIHPIGVGISKWFYNRLYQAFEDTNNASNPLYLITPDLLGSGSAVHSEDAAIPLFNISDWSDQIAALMNTLEETYADIDQWCLVTNGGCSPIALQIAQRSVDAGDVISFQRPVTNVILSSVPRPPFFLQGNDPKKVAKAYKRLCGVIGKAFWWYACRNDGAFIQKFSEKNLVADPANLGNQWRKNCFQVASQNGGKSKYSTFAFLAGTLQGGCVASLKALKEHRDKIRVHVIKGRDTRQNRAKSWFWQKRKREKQQEPGSLPTFRDYLEENGLGGNEILIGGRISLAHEDAEGYRDAILSFLS